MPRKPRQLPAQNTLPYLLLTLTALCGEYPIRQISHLPGGSAYLESVVTALRRDGLLRTFSKDGLRGLRLTSSAKRLLLADAPEWFSAYLTGSSEPNKLKSEIPRRLRLHRMAEILTIMHNADIPAFPWEKAPFSAASQSAAIPAYYTSREVKEIGPQGTKIKSSRATGILLTDGGIFLTYNTAKAQMKWEYKAELRFKALLQTEGVMPDAEISGIVFGSTMEQLSILTQPDAHSYFLLDGSFPHFYYLTNDRYGEAILRLLCDTQQRRTLDVILADGLHEGIPNWRVENDAIDSEGNPVLFAYEEKGGYLMPKKKMIPPPDDFSSEFMETESAKELSEQQVEAAGSDNTETPLAEPPEVDLGSGDVSGTTDVEENELDAENTADAAETVPVSDEKAEDPEYDSILQELNSSTPAPLDSSGENALDALLLEENVENAPPAEDETESADGEAAPQPTAPPAPAGRRDSYILTVDAKDRIETEEERREVIWHEIKTSHIAGRILTGTLDGVEQTPSGRTIVVVDYKGYRIAIPLKEMMLYSGPVPYGAKYKPFMERMNSILATMLTAEIDFIVRGLDNTARSVVASRKAAMLRKRQTFYLDTNEDGVPMIYEGRVVQARVIGVAEKVLRVEVFGVECTIFARDLSAAWFGDAREYYSVGDRVLVRVLTIDRDDINHISITADIRSVSSAANQSNLDKCVLQGKYAGRVTDVRHGVVFIRLNNGVNAVAHTCYDRRMPGKKDDVSFAVTRLDEERGIAVGIITRIIKQNL